MKYRGYIVSHGGNVRTNNEDNGYLDGYYRLNDKEFAWNYEKEKENSIMTAVFDGMGGEDNGEVASRLAVRTMYSMKNKRFSDITEEYTINAGKKIQNNANGTHMGTTYTALSVEDNVYYFSNLGDSRGYLFRDGVLTQMTKDHNMIQEMLKNGILTEEQAQKHPDRHTLYQYLGMREEEEEIEPEPYIAEPVEAQSGDICLLCTDGLTDMLSDQEISNILSEKQLAEEKIQKLLKTALEHGGKDNITILVLEAI